MTAHALTLLDQANRARLQGDDAAANILMMLYVRELEGKTK